MHSSVHLASQDVKEALVRALNIETYGNIILIKTARCIKCISKNDRKIKSLKSIKLLGKEVLYA